MDRSRWKLFGALAAVLLVLGQAWRWKSAREAQAQAPEVWVGVLDDAFAPDLADHASRWDGLLKPDSSGGLYVRPWLHATLAPLERGPFRMKAELQFIGGNTTPWLELVAASPVEYDEEDRGGVTSPRSRFAGVFGRVDLGTDGATLSVGQMGLDGKGRRVVVRRVAMNTAGAMPPMELSLHEDRLQLRFGPHELSTLADQIPAFLSSTARFGVRGEQCKVLHLSAQVLTPTAEDRALVEAETYLGAGRNDQAIPSLAEMNALSPTPRLQIRPARAYEQVSLPEEAAKLWPALTDTAKAGFYAGYAQLELLRARARANADPLALDNDLARLASSLNGHPVLPQLLLLRARLLALGDTGKATARALAVEALGGTDPEVAAEAMQLLSASSLAYEPAELLAVLDELAAERPNAMLAELLALKRAELSLQLGDLKGLAELARASRPLTYATRKRVYAMLDQALAAPKTAKALASASGEALARLLGEAAGDAAWLQDYLYVRAFPQYRPAAQQKELSSAQDRAFYDLLHAFTRLPKGGSVPGTPYYVSATAKASAYGQVPQGELTEGAAGSLCLDYVSGAYWGCGIAIPGAVQDLKGARVLHAKVQAPKGTSYYFTLSESGVASPTSAAFAGKDGADGEHYLLPGKVGTGDWQELELPLQEATVSLTWGNPNGNHQLDLQAIDKIDLAVPGKQGDGLICVKDIRFTGGR